MRKLGQLDEFRKFEQHHGNNDHPDSDQHKAHDGDDRHLHRHGVVDERDRERGVLCGFDVSRHRDGELGHGDVYDQLVLGWLAQRLRRL